MYETLITLYESPMYFSKDMAKDAGVDPVIFKSAWNKTITDRSDPNFNACVNCKTIGKYLINKEIIQEIVICGLSRGGFFNEAAFYGGTALRIFYGLDRFSEDLDFSLETTDLDFDLLAYFPVLEKEVRSFGLKVDIMEKEKTKDRSKR